MTNEDAIKFLQQLYPYGGHCWLDEQRIEAIGMAIEALRGIARNGKDCKDDPVSDDFEEACNQMSDAARISKCEAGKPFFSEEDYKLGFKAGANWQKKKDDEMLTVVYMDGVEKGKKMTREQMMEDADVASITHKTSNIYEEIIIFNGSRYAHDSVRYTSD